MNTMNRLTINLLGAGLLLGVTAARAQEKAPAAFDEKAAATALYFETLSALPWTELRDRFDNHCRGPIPPWPKGDKALEERFKPPYGALQQGTPVRRELQERKDRMWEDLTKRQGEVYKQILEGKVNEAFPTVFDQFVLCMWLTDYARGGRCEGYFEARHKEVLGEAGMAQLAAEQRRVGTAIEKYMKEDRLEYEAVAKPAIEANPEWAAAESRLKLVMAKEEELGIAEWLPRDDSRKRTPEEAAAVQAVAKEYNEATEAARRFRDAFSKKDPENNRLQRAAGIALDRRGPHDWMMLHHGPFVPYRALFARERQVCKLALGWHGPDWLLVGPDPAPDPALPRIDESGRKPGTAKSLDLGNPSTGSTGSPQASSGQGNVKLELVWIPAGEFMMGSPTNEPGRDMQERLHRVKLTKGFWMGKYEVTQEQWQQVMGNNPSWFTNAGPKAPVETVRWDQAQKFMRKLGEMTAGKDGAGGKFRLPTEAEWEWACRAGTDQALYNGKMTIKGANNGPELDAIAWYGGNSGVEYEGGSLSAHWPDKQQEHRFAGTHPAGQKKPNAWGLFDMLGNVWEWCEDMHYAYPSRAVTDPMERAKDKESFGGTLRGGAWNSYVRLCRSASRDWTYYPEMWRNAMIGFRVAMDEPAAAEKAK